MGASYGFGRAVINEPAQIMEEPVAA